VLLRTNSPRLSDRRCSKPFLGRTAFRAGLLLVLCFSISAAETGQISGQISDLLGVPVVSANLKLLNASGTVVREAASDSQGNFAFINLGPGQYKVTADAASFAPVSSDVTVVEGRPAEVNLRFKQLASVSQSVTVFGTSTSVLEPDSSERVVVRDQSLDANPGRPGAPISIPGLPIETASGGIKAPQYFAPGVAGDHGEPIAQFYQIGNFLYPNNLPANAHGNGYSDPNFLIASTIDAVTVDGGAFNVREGNHSVDLAAAYVPRQRLDDFVELTGDYRDSDLVAGWSPSNPDTNGWIAAEASFGNGYLERLEHRQQYKLNGFREFKPGRHDITLFGVGYYGFSFVPGLIPINIPVNNDTVDNRQLDRTNTSILVATDTWSLSPQSQFTFSGFFREYSLVLRSNFSPDFTQQPFIGGLIQQSEFRTVVGGGPLYTQKVRPWLSILAGTDLRRDAPRGLDLRSANAQGIFGLVTSNNLTLSFVEPYAAVDGKLSRYVHFDVGFRREEVWIDNQDKINPLNSFDKLAGLTLPKASLTILPPQNGFLPTIAFSYGEAFHTEDPRIGTGTGEPTLLAPSRAYQLVLDETLKKFELRFTLKHVTNSQELAKIDPDTGLQEDVGPSLNRVISVSLQRTFSHGSIFISYAQADARDLLTGEPTPEAPRLIWDAIATENHLPFGLRARAEFEYVRKKPLGEGCGPAANVVCIGEPVPEFRGAVLRPFFDGRMVLSTEFLIANGYTGQTTEVFAYPSDPTFAAPFQRIVGVPLKSYITMSWTYHFRQHKP
jgi:Carboxypeptidase regulatory-like domain